jgi:hypothetical protein
MNLLAEQITARYNPARQGVRSPRHTSLFKPVFSSCKEFLMAKARRTTLRSSKGTKLYAVRDQEGKFEDIQTYERAHRADMAHKSKAEGMKAAKKKAAPKAKPMAKAAAKSTAKPMAKAGAKTMAKPKATAKKK